MQTSIERQVLSAPLNDFFIKARSVWEEKFGSYATLTSYDRSKCGTSQSWTQQDALIKCVPDAEKMRELYSIDTGSKALNCRIQNFLSTAFFHYEDREKRMLAAEKAKKVAAELEEKQKLEAANLKAKELLEKLELKEKLLSYVGEFGSEQALRRSVLLKQAMNVPEVESVISKKPYQRFGHYSYTWLLTFREKESD